MGKILIKILGFLVPIGAMFIYYKAQHTTKEMKTEIVHLEAANDSIKKQNKELQFENQTLTIKLFESDNALQVLKEKDAELLLQIQNLTKQMDNIKVKYEKAANFTRNYTSDSISNYFSNLK